MLSLTLPGEGFSSNTLADFDALSWDPARGGIPSPKRWSDEEAGEGSRTRKRASAEQSNTQPTTKDTFVQQKIADQNHRIARACLEAQLKSATRRADRAEESLADEADARAEADARPRRAEFAEDVLGNMRIAAAAGDAAIRWAANVQDELTELRAIFNSLCGAAVPNAAPVDNEEDTPVRQEIADQDHWIVRACLEAQLKSAARSADRAEASLAVEVAARIAADARAEIAEYALNDMQMAVAAGGAATRWATSASVQNELTELRAEITELRANAAA
jgi:hypothetical protein